MLSVATIQEKIQLSMESFHDRIALEYRGDTYTYRQLDHLSERVAQGIVNKGIEKGTFVGVFLHDRFDVVTSLLGILKAGCVFVPLDPNYPVERIQSMIKKAELKYVITDDKTNPLLTDVHIRTLALSMMEESPESLQPGITHYAPDDCVYLYFTSGTSGSPNAVMGRNKGLLHFIEWEVNEFSINSNSRVSQLTSPCHDPFLRDVFVPLCAGGTICIPDSTETILDTKQFYSWIKRSQVNIIHSTPSLFRNFVKYIDANEQVPELEYILLAGEEIHPSDLTDWFRKMGDRIQLVNLYGPTETTLAKLFYRITSDDINRVRIPIGQPISGTRAVILDEFMQVCEVGVKGEIYIRTPYRSLGYFNDNDLNNEKFIPNPFSNNQLDLIYKTGDLGRVLEDHNIEFLGRVDRQIKIRGYRVELEEIESKIIHSDLVGSVAVITHQLPSGDVQIRAFVTPSSKTDHVGDELESEIKESLIRLLPDYMIPSRIIVISEMPVTNSGKIDYSSLVSVVDDDQYEKPIGEIEEGIAEIWGDILGIEKIGRTDDFMKLGGNSIYIMNMIAQIYERFEVELSLEQVFTDSRLNNVADIIASSEKSEWTGNNI